MHLWQSVTNQMFGAQKDGAAYVHGPELLRLEKPHRKSSGESDGTDGELEEEDFSTVKFFTVLEGPLGEPAVQQCCQAGNEGLLAEIQIDCILTEIIGHLLTVNTCDFDRMWWIDKRTKLSNYHPFRISDHASYRGSNTLTKNNSLQHTIIFVHLATLL